MDKQPCKRDCPKRSATCHCTCEDWAEWEKSKNKRYLEKRVQLSVTSYFFSRNCEKKHSYNRKKRR